MTSILESISKNGFLNFWASSISVSGVATAFCIEVLSKYAPTLSSLLIAVADAYITPLDVVDSRLVILPTELESPDPIWDSSITTIEFGAMASDAS